MTKPFSPRELVLRASAVLRRVEEEPGANGGQVLEDGPLRVDLKTHVVRSDGESIDLTHTEFRLLVDLMSARGNIRSRDALLSDVWGFEADVMSRTVDTHIRRLRNKLGPGSAWISTVRGVGYRFRDPGGE